MTVKSSASPPSHRPIWIWLAAASLLIAHFGLAIGSKWHESTTSDEIAHLTAGFAYWRFNDYRLQPENGVLPQRWAALPTFLQGATFPTLNQAAWRQSDVWKLGHQFFYETGQDHFPRLMAARAMIALFSVGTGLLVFLWSRTLFGAAAALFSLTLFAFSPLFLAHGALATSDVCMGFFFLASVGSWWRHLHDRAWSMALLSAVLFALACVAKFSAVLLLPMFALLAGARLLEPHPIRLAGKTLATFRGKLAAIAGSAVAHAAVAYVVIWAFYGFRYSAFSPALAAGAQFIQGWDLIAANIGLPGRIVGALASAHVLPEAFLYGLGYVIDSARMRGAFLNGEYSTTGWWNFFPWTFLLKTTLPVLLTCAVGPAIFVRRWSRHRAAIRRDLQSVAPLVVLFVVYGAFSLTSHLNIGQRHILPVYPVIFIAAGAIVAGARSWRSPLRWAAIGLALWQVTDAIRLAPHFLAYFNCIAGGPANGYRHLVDSSLDWGQDLPGLKKWLDANVAADTPVYLSYSGTGEPAYYGIRAREIMMLNGFEKPDKFVRLQPGVYCISVTALQQVYSPVHGTWTPEFEQAYQSLRLLEPAFVDQEEHPENRAKWEKSMTRNQWAVVQKRYEVLRFARLCLFLRAENPDAQIGYSINVYRIGADDFAAVLNGNFSQWRLAVERALARRP